jgi:hypothetical protein
MGGGGGGGCGGCGVDHGTVGEGLEYEDSDVQLASKFQLLLADLETLRGWARGGLWLSMLLLVRHTFKMFFNE